MIPRKYRMPVAFGVLLLVIFVSDVLRHGWQDAFINLAALVVVGVLAVLGLVWVFYPDFKKARDAQRLADKVRATQPPRCTHPRQPTPEQWDRSGVSLWVCGDCGQGVPNPELEDQR